MRLTNSFIKGSPHLNFLSKIVKSSLEKKLKKSLRLRKMVGVQEYSTAIPNNIFKLISPKLDDFLNNKFVNLNNISQK